jgi:hypothetical protein
MRRAALLLLAGTMGPAALLAVPSPADAAVTTVFCNAFPANPNPPGNGTRACGTQFKSNTASNPVDNGSVFNSIVDTSNSNRPDREGMYSGNIAANAAGTTRVRTITGDSALTLLDATDISGVHGTLAFAKTQTQSNGTRADGGTWTYTPFAGDLFQPTVLAVKASTGSTVWNVPIVRSMAGVFSGLWSTEGIVNNQGAQSANFHALSHMNVYGVVGVVPLPTAAWMFLTAVAGLVGWRRWQGRGDQAAAPA